VAKDFVVTFVMALAAGLGATVFFELRGAASWSSGRLIKIAVRLLPESIREEYEEMWLADIGNWKDGALGRLVTALGMIVAAARMGRQWERNAAEPSRGPSASPTLIKLLDGTIEIWMNGAARVTIPSPEAEGLHALEQTEQGLTELSVIEWVRTMLGVPAPVV